MLALGDPKVNLKFYFKGVFSNHQLQAWVCMWLLTLKTQHNHVKSIKPFCDCSSNIKTTSLQRMHGPRTVGTNLTTMRCIWWLPLNYMLYGCTSSIQQGILFSAGVETFQLNLNVTICQNLNRWIQRTCTWVFDKAEVFANRRDIQSSSYKCIIEIISS